VHCIGGGYYGEGFFLSRRIIFLLSEIARRRGIPMIFSGVTVGPFEAGMQQDVAERVFRSASAVDVRDHRSDEFFSNLGIPYSLTCDDAFLMRLRSDSRRRADETPDDIVVNVQLGAETVEEPEFSVALDVMARAMAHLRALLGDRVRFQCLAFFSNDPSDMAAGNAVLERVPELRARTTFHDLSNVSPWEALDVIGRGRVTIASRLHAAILTFVAGRPAYTLYHGHSPSHSERLRRPHAQFGSQWIEPFHEADPARVAGRIAVFLNSPDVKAREDEIGRIGNSLAQLKVETLRKNMPGA
jgi:polysaccharide pyruvyl transferase WcaK-like protein